MRPTESEKIYDNAEIGILRTPADTSRQASISSLSDMPRQPSQKRAQPLYPKLPSGRSARSSQDIAANQLERLKGGMIHAISNRGYHNTTVADIIALAGVARRTFYEHFNSKEECFLAAYDTALEQITGNVEEAYNISGTWEERIQAAFLALAEEVISNPEATELLLIHSASAGAASIERRNQGVLAFESLLREGFSETPEYREISDMTVKTIVGGARQLAYSRLRHGRAIELPDLVAEFLSWVRSYRNPVALKSPPHKAPKRAKASKAPTLGRDAKLSRGRHNLSRGFVIHNQRARILDAVASICASNGYLDLTVPEIASAAGVSHKTFYEHFANKDQAFAAAFELAGQRALNTTAVAYASQPDWPHSIRAGMHSLLDYLASEPSFARMGMVEVLAGGPAALAQRDQSLQGFSVLLTVGRGYSSTHEVPKIAPEVISGGILEVLYFEISNGRIAQLPSLLPELTYIALTPFIGTKQAAKIASEPLAAKPA
jgi:AcrR family transcriptional regulator